MKENSKRSTPVNLYQLLGVFTPEQDKAISKIYALLLELILRSLDANGQMGVTKSRSAFEMFKLGKTICDIFGLPPKTWVMIYFDGQRPVVSWEENDLRTIQSKTGAELEGNAIELERYVNAGVKMHRLAGEKMHQ
jgi:hypothetical protein